MHRSGTSALGNVLCELGWSIGLSPAPHADDNMKGFFENVSTMKLHDEMLFSANSTWSDPHPIDPDWWTQKRLGYWSARIRSLLKQEFEEHDLCLIKDPRMCRLMPPWLEALGNEPEPPLFFLLFRHPGEVAASLAARNGMSTEYGMLLWLVHCFEAEKASRGAKRTLLIHDRLLNGSENQKIAELTGRQLKDVKAAYNKAVSPELRHHTHQGKMPLSGTKLGSICEQLWAYLSELTDGDQNLKAIDTLRSEFENHLRIIPREFYGAFTTGPQMPPHDVLSFLEPLSREGPQTGSHRAMVRVQGEDFIAEFEGINDGCQEYTWRLDLPFAFEISIEQIKTGWGNAEWTHHNAFDSDGTTVRFFSGQARYNIVVRHELAGGNGSDVGDSVRIVGRLRRIGSIRIGSELEQVTARHKRTAADRVREGDKLRQQIAADLAREMTAREEKLREMSSAEINRVEEAVAHANATISRVEKGVAIVNTEISRVEKGVAIVNTEISRVEKGVAIVNTEINRTEKDVARAIVEIKRVEDGVTLTNKEFNGISKRLEQNSARLSVEIDKISTQAAKSATNERARIDSHFLSLKHHIQSVAEVQNITLQLSSNLLSKLAAAFPSIFLLSPRLRRGRKRLIASGLFDRKHYLDQCPVGLTIADPCLHYLVAGWKLGIIPTPLITKPCMSRIASSVGSEKRVPLLAYLELTSLWHLAPNELFDPAYYLSEYPQVAASGIHPLAHFASHGAFDGFQPNPLFDPSWYLLKYSDIRESGVNPLVHYLTSGNKELRQPCALFDVEFYLEKHPEIAESATNPLIHYLEVGAQIGANPNRLFDSAWYLREYPEVGEAGVNPLAHFLKSGARQGMNPNPLFDTSFYLETYQDVIGSGMNPLQHYLESGAIERRHPNRMFELFDPAYYLSEYPEVAASGIQPLAHFACYGAFNGFKPNPLFDPSWYLSKYPDIRESGANPLVHYMTAGGREGRNPCALFDAQWYLEQHPHISELGNNPLVHYLTVGARTGANPNRLFDSEWYLQEYPEVEKAGFNPLAHFLKFGAWQGMNPHPLFDTSFYLSKYPDIRESGINPLLHYMTSGGREGLQPCALFEAKWYLEQHPEISESGDNPLVHYLTVGVLNGANPNRLFDSEWYLQKYPEVEEAGINPLAHFLKYGTWQGINPHPLFDTSFYLETYPDIAESGMNPLQHYLERGGIEGRFPNRVFDGVAYLGESPDVVAHGMNPLWHYITYGERAGRRIPGRFDPAFYLKQLDERPERGTLLEHYLGTGTDNGLSPVSITEEFDLVAPRFVVLPENPRPMVSIVIPVFNQFLFTLNCLHCISQAKTGIPYEVIVVDDASTDETPSIISRVFHLRYLRNISNEGFGETCNRGAAVATGEFVLFLNNDTKVGDGWLEAFVEAARLPNTGYVGAKLVYPDGRLQEAGGMIWRDGSAWNYGNGQDPSDPMFNYIRKVDYCSAAAAMMPRKLFQDLGGFSPEFEKAYYEDTDLCMRIRQSGMDVVYQPEALVYHFEGGTCGTNTASGLKQYQLRNQEVFIRKWEDTLRDHPENGDIAGHFKHLYPAGTILFIDDLLPLPKLSSGGVRSWNIIVVLLKLGFHVTIMPVSPCAEPELRRAELEKMGLQVLGPPYHPAPEEWIAGDMGPFALQEFDKVIVARHPIATRLYPVIRDRMPNASIIFDTVDLHFVRLRREAKITRDLHTIKMAELSYQEESGLLETCEQTWVVSETERVELSKINPDADVRLISNIVPVEGTNTDWERRDGLLFIGGFNHTPNQDAVVWFLNEIYPIVLSKFPDMVFHILGSFMPEEFHALASRNVNPVGFVDDPAEWFEKVRLSVAPLRYGAGVKGKVNQSLALGVPAVGTNIAFEGMGDLPGECVLMSDDPKAMAEHIIDLYGESEKWALFSAKGIEIMNEMYSLDTAEMSIRTALAEVRTSSETLDGAPRTLSLEK